VDKERARAWENKVKETESCYDVYMEDRLRTSIDFNTIMAEALEAGNIPAVLEVDHNRGVIYVHDATQGITALRICGLQGDTRIPLDITIAALADARDIRVDHPDVVMKEGHETRTVNK
jgi:hypothetical protein